MAIAVLNPPVGNIGPGMDIRGNLSVFPVAAGDYVEAIIPAGAFTLSYTSADVTDVSTGFFQGHIGLDEHSGTGWRYPQTGLQAGVAIVVTYNWRNAGGGLVETISTAGYAWDPVSAITGMLQHFDSRLNILQGDLDQVLSQLRTVLGNTEGGVFHNPLIGVLHSALYAGNPILGGTTNDLTLPAFTTNWALTWEAVVTPGYVGGEIGVITDSNRR